MNVARTNCRVVFGIAVASRAENFSANNLSTRRGSADKTFFQPFAPSQTQWNRQFARVDCSRAIMFSTRPHSPL
jgi:hypothetical protein